jgi:hypothetical protein
MVRFMRIPPIRLGAKAPVVEALKIGPARRQAWLAPEGKLD